MKFAVLFSCGAMPQAMLLLALAACIALLRVHADVSDAAGAETAAELNFKRALHLR